MWVGGWVWVRAKIRSPCESMVMTHCPNFRPVQRIGPCELYELPRAEPFATEIFPWLYLGNARDAVNYETLRQKGVKYILNVSKEVDTPEAEEKGFHYLKLDLAHAHSLHASENFPVLSIFSSHLNCVISNSYLMIHNHSPWGFSSLTCWPLAVRVHFGAPPSSQKLVPRRQGHFPPSFKVLPALSPFVNIMSVGGDISQRYGALSSWVVGGGRVCLSGVF